jgi:hypothetical protein
LDLNRLSTGDRVIGVSGLLLFVFSFLDWLGIQASSTGPGPLGVPFTAGDSRPAWDFPVTMIAVVIGLVMLGLVAIKAFGADMPRLGPVTWGQLFLALGVVAFFLIAIKLVTGPSNWPLGDRMVDIDSVRAFCKAGPNCESFSTTREVGMILGTLAAGGLLVGGYLRNQEDSSTAPVTRSRASANA